MNLHHFIPLFATFALACKPEPATQPPTDPGTPVAPEVPGPPASDPPNTMSGEPPADPIAATDPIPTTTVASASELMLPDLSSTKFTRMSVGLLLLVMALLASAPGEGGDGLVVAPDCALA